MTQSKSTEYAKRRRVQFSLRAMLLLVSLLGVALAWYSSECTRIEKHMERKEVLLASGAGVFDAEEWARYVAPFDERRIGKAPDPPLGRWLFGDGYDYVIFGIDYHSYSMFPSPNEFHIGDRELNAITSCTELRHLGLAFTDVTDRDLLRLSHLVHLESLDLSGTAITDQSLSAIAQMSKLKSLSMSATQINGSRLYEIAALKGLSSVDLSRTTLDEGLGALASCPGIESLNLSETRLSSECLCEIKSITIRTLKLSAARISGEGWLAKARLPNLRELWYEGQPVSHEFISALNNWKHLVFVALDWNELTTPQLSEILPRLPNLTRLNLAGASINDDIVCHIGVMRSLHSLDLSDTVVDNRGMSVIAGLSNLEELYLAQTRIDSTGIGDLEDLSRLRVLDISFTSVDDKAVPSLTRLTSLRELRVFGTSLSSAGIQSIRQKLPSCQIEQ